MVTTVAMRKEQKLARLRAAIEQVEADLSDFAIRHGGQFVIFGSAARGELRHDSDLDILVAFPPAMEREARHHAEGTAHRHGVILDVHLVSEASPDLLDRIKRDGRS